MICGWHFLDDSDPLPPLGASTFLSVGRSAVAQESPERMCRLYFKGRPNIAELVAEARVWALSGARLQFGNEQNHPIEGYNGTPADYRADFRAFRNGVKELVPDARVYWGAPSPGIEGWQAWYDGAEEADGIIVHAYGNLTEMQVSVIYARVRFPEKPLWVAECNFGPAEGKIVDLEWWANTQLRPFLDWCAKLADIEAVTYFAYRWPTPDSPQGTPVDGAGTAVEQVLREWRDPMTNEQLQAEFDFRAQQWEAKLDQLLRQSAIFTKCWALLRQGKFTGADGIDGAIVELQGGQPLDFEPTYPNPA